MEDITSGRVVQLRRYPVKSVGGEALHEATLSERGVAGDRVYGLVDRDTGKLGSAKHPRRWGGLLACRAVATPTLHDGLLPVVRITLPDGRVVIAGSDEANEALSALLGHDVFLTSSVPDQAEIERYWPDIEGMAQRDVVTSGGIGGGAPPGSFFDYAPVHLVTTATLSRLQTLHPSGCFDARRFRPNLVIAVEGAEQGFVENDWIGRTLAVGDEVRLRVTTPSPRCIVPTLAQPNLPRDVDVLRTIARHNRPPIPILDGAMQPSAGVYAVVEQGGRIGDGDVVQVA